MYNSNVDTVIIKVLQEDLSDILESSTSSAEEVEALSLKMAETIIKLSRAFSPSDIESNTKSYKQQILLLQLNHDQVEKISKILEATFHFEQYESLLTILIPPLLNAVEAKDITEPKLELEERKAASEDISQEITEPTMQSLPSNVIGDIE